VIEIAPYLVVREDCVVMMSLEQNCEIQEFVVMLEFVVVWVIPFWVQVVFVAARVVWHVVLDFGIV
jgi:hypothetical protein